MNINGAVGQLCAAHVLAMLDLSAFTFSPGVAALVAWHIGPSHGRYQEMAGRHRADPGSIQIIHAAISGSLSRQRPFHPSSSSRQIQIVVACHSGRWPSLLLKATTIPDDKCRREHVLDCGSVDEIGAVRQCERSISTWDHLGIRRCTTVSSSSP